MDRMRGALRPKRDLKSPAGECRFAWPLARQQAGENGEGPSAKDVTVNRLDPLARTHMGANDMHPDDAN